MDLERLREFIELAHQLNFTSAAKVLHISQPTLSNHLKSLENEIGYKLVERTLYGDTRLTLAGQEFLTMVQSIINTYDLALIKIKEMSHVMVGKIRIRMPRYEFSQPFLTYAYEFEAEHPDIEMIYYPWIPEDGYFDVISKKVDCAYVGQGSVIDGVSKKYPTINLITFSQQEGLVWMSRYDQLATKDTLTIDDLDGRYFAIPANFKNETWRENHITVANEGGIEINFNEKYCDSLEDFIMNKINTNELLIIQKSMKDLPVFDMQTDRYFRSLTPPLMYRMSLVYNNTIDNAALSIFIQFLREKYVSQ